MTHDEIIMMRASSGARRLDAISTQPASTAAGVTFKDSLSFSTDLSLHRQRPARSSEATGREVSHGSTAKTANDRFTVLRPWYELSTLSIRTVGYALGRSGSARRDLPGFLAVRTLYIHSPARGGGGRRANRPVRVRVKSHLTITRYNQNPPSEVRWLRSATGHSLC